MINHLITIKLTKIKAIAAITYLTFIGLIIAFILNSEIKNRFITYHIKQSLGITFTTIVLLITTKIPILGWVVSLLGAFFILFLWVMGLINAIKGIKEPVPIIGIKTNELFKAL